MQFPQVETPVRVCMTQTCWVQVQQSFSVRSFFVIRQYVVKKSFSLWGIAVHTQKVADNILLK